MLGGENTENNGQLCRKGRISDRISAFEEEYQEYRSKVGSAKLENTLKRRQTT